VEQPLKSIVAASAPAAAALTAIFAAIPSR
jgi:hypothetical protein